MHTWLLACVVLAAGCGDDSNNSTMPDGNNGTMGDGSGANGCPRTPAAADRDRYVVVAHPYNTTGQSASTFEVLKLSSAGALSAFSPPRIFMLGNRMPFGNITFTPDGKLGIAPLDNGKLGVFALDNEGIVTVVDPGFVGSFYADRVVMDPSGDLAWVVDRNTRDNGGGLYQVAIACNGTLTDLGQLAPARSPGGLAFVGTRAVVAARDILSSPSTVSDVHILDVSANPPTYVGGGDAFGDDDQAFSGFALSSDGTTAFIGDSNFAGPDRVTIATLDATSVTSFQVISMITDPSSIVVSPFGDVAVVASSQPPNEGIYVLDTGGTNGAWRNRGELTYLAGTAELPGDMVLVDRGTLSGHVLVSELSRVRQLSIDPSGSVTDSGSLLFGDGLEHIGGAIGIQP
jgi:hypothetical protein